MFFTVGQIHLRDLSKNIEDDNFVQNRNGIFKAVIGNAHKRIPIVQHFRSEMILTANRLIFARSILYIFKLRSNQGTSVNLNLLAVQISYSDKKAEMGIGGVQKSDRGGTRYIEVRHSGVCG